MHGYIITRGIKHDVDRFITELQGKYLPYEYEKGKQAVVQFSIRPIQLWEVVFPEPELQKVMHTLFEGTTRPDAGLTYLKRNNKYLWALRKTLSSQQFPNLDKTSLSMPIYKGNIEVAGIGIKKDLYKDGVEQL